jgi:hypothetical protein
MAFSYYVITKNYDKLSKHQQLDEESRLWVIADCMI